jgi:hypothetical protein
MIPPVNNYSTSSPSASDWISNRIDSVKTPPDKTYIALPTSILLSRDGVSAISKTNLAIKKIMNHDGFYNEGLSSEGFNAPVMQKMIMKSMINELHISMPEMLRKRQEILSTNSLILYAILYKKIGPALSEILLKSEALTDYNRKNPKNSIVSLRNISKERVIRFRQKYSQEFSVIQSALKIEILQKINDSPDLMEDDKQAIIRSLDKFIRWVDDRIWYLYFVFNRAGSKDHLRKKFAEVFRSYLNKTLIAVHSGNLLMEFIQNAEKAHFIRLIHNISAGRIIDPEFFLRSPENRRKITALAERTGELMNLSWVIQSSKTAMTSQFRLVIIVSNLGLIDEKQKKHIQKKMKAVTEGISLAGFYSNDGSDRLGAGLGLLYNSYIEDLCRKKGIYYKAAVYPEPSKEKTTVRLEFIF